MIDASERRDQRLIVYIVAVTALAAGLITLLVAATWGFWAGTDWIVFGLFGTLLFLAETQPSFTMKFGDNGSVSPGWTFAYALVLFAMPVEALAVLLAANLAIDLRTRRPAKIVVFNLAQIGGSLSAGALVLDMFGVDAKITALDTIPLRWGIGVALGAATILALNGFFTAIAISLHTGVGFTTVYRSGLALSVTADGALLSLAPIFVIAVDYSLLLVPLLATTSYIVIRSARSSLQRAHDASHDPLTGLLNRRAFDDRIASALQTDAGTCRAVVLVMDFDRFKEINDSLGHAVGDALLKGFGDRLADDLPARGSAARLGGDEFAVVIPHPGDQPTIERAIADLHDRLVEPFDIDGFPLSVTVSIGVAVAPSDGTNAQDLLAAADLAMYRAKRFQRGVEYHHHEGLGSGRSGSGGRIDLLSDLATAIEHGKLTAHYQPQIDLSTGMVDSIEALVRWNHPRYGPIRPVDFIGLAEQTDLIDDLTELMLRRATADVLRLDDTSISVAVNVSPRSLHERTFAATVLDVLDETALPPERLELEITERAIAEDPERMELTVSLLREAGIRVAIDDFGTGYSSFASLRRIPADRLKIDRQFTKQIANSREDRLVVETITQLAHGLGLAVVVEGVEDADLLATLQLMGCDMAQGYAIAAPMPFDQLRAHLREANGAGRREAIA